MGWACWTSGIFLLMMIRSNLNFLPAENAEKSQFRLNKEEGLLSRSKFFPFVFSESSKEKNPPLFKTA